MIRHLLVVDRSSDLKRIPTEYIAVTSAEYMSNSNYANDRRLRIINLCHSFRYQNTGYYCSLLAEARGQRVLPSVRAMLDLERQSLYHPLGENINQKTQQALSQLSPEQNQLDVPVYFGQTQLPELRELAGLAFETYAFPALSISFKYNGSWRIHAIRNLDIQRLDENQHQRWLDSLQLYLGKNQRLRRQSKPARYDLAILHDPKEQLAPSNPAALQKFIKAGNKQGLNVELIQRSDFSRLAEFDALFLRETTRIDHHTYRFARKAEAENMVVMDDANSILKCSNKVFLAELLRGHKIPTPKTLILRKENLAEAQTLGFPVVLKIPDSAFSQGVFKADDAQSLQNLAEPLFKRSELVLAQEFAYTSYDWRIGLLDGEPLYACRYYMSKRHWQIVNHAAKQQRDVEGAADTLAIEDAPKDVVDVATRACKLIGNGLYGVDLKQTNRGIMLIEINDNPSIDAGIEDKHLGNKLYDRIITSFVQRLENKRAPWNNN